MSQSYWYS